jgi:hypothetical protein
VDRFSQLRRRAGIAQPFTLATTNRPLPARKPHRPIFPFSQHRSFRSRQRGRRRWTNTSLRGFVDEAGNAETMRSSVKPAYRGRGRSIRARYHVLSVATSVSAKPGCEAERNDHQGGQRRVGIAPPSGCTQPAALPVRMLNGRRQAPATLAHPTPRLSALRRDKIIRRRASKSSHDTRCIAISLITCSGVQAGLTGNNLASFWSRFRIVRILFLVTKRGQGVWCRRALRPGPRLSLLRR